MLTEAGAKALRKMVDEANEEVSAIIFALVEELGSYGFRGEARSGLSVEITDKHFGGKEAEIERKNAFQFKP